MSELKFKNKSLPFIYVRDYKMKTIPKSKQRHGSFCGQVLVCWQGCAHGRMWVRVTQEPSPILFTYWVAWFKILQKLGTGSNSACFSIDTSMKPEPSTGWFYDFYNKI